MIKNLEVNNNSRIKFDRLLIHKLIGLLKKEFDLNISSLLINFVSSNQIQKINSEYLKHNYSTDIITFNYSKEKRVVDSEIFISVDDAEFNAGKFGVSFNEEILRLVIHGILHLLGYDDTKPELKRKMKQKESRLVGKYRNTLIFVKEQNI